MRKKLVHDGNCGGRIRDTLLVGVFCIILIVFAVGEGNLVQERADTAGDIMIACIGDSITRGVEVEPEQTYPACLQKKLGEGYQVLNYGKKGRALLEDSRHAYVREDVYQVSRERAADLYVIMLGSNDIWEESWNKEDFLHQLVQFVTSYQQVQGGPFVYLVKPPQYFPSEDDMRGQEKKTYMPDLLWAIEQAAEETGCGLIDLHTYTKNHPEWFADEVHPNAEGNEKIAAYIYENIARDLNL